MPVKLRGRSHPAHNAARMVYHTDHRPCGCQGIKELNGPSRGHGLIGIDVKSYQNSLSPRTSGSRDKALGVWASGLVGSRVNVRFN